MIYYHGTVDNKPIPIRILTKWKGRVEITRDISGNSRAGFWVRQGELIQEDPIEDDEENKQSLCL